jgi:glycosyltransferase involved in cell wall biosynthesis
MASFRQCQQLVMPPPSSPPDLHRISSSRRAGAAHDLLDAVDVAIVVSRQAPWQLATLQAALSADLSRQWCGGVVVVDDGAPPAGARAARATLAEHHPLARRTVLTLPRRLGTAAAANLALAEATGEYVALVDVATRPSPGTLRRLTVALEADHDALWAATTTPGFAVLRRVGFLDLGGFDPALRGGAAVRDLARRATIDGRRLLTVAHAHAHRDGPPGGARRRGRPQGRAPQRRPWSAGALAVWLPRVRLGVRRDDLA